jgi:competence protein ComEC
MLFYQPQELTDVSFQLSFLSTLGIITIKPILDRVAGLRVIWFVKDDVITTISAQIATLPVMLSAFGSYSLLSFPINILVLWTIPVIMIFGGTGAVISLISPFIALPFMLLCYPFLAYFTGIIVFFSRFNSQLSLEGLPFTILSGYYLILLAIVIRFGSNKSQNK